MPPSAERANGGYRAGSDSTYLLTHLALNALRNIHQQSKTAVENDHCNITLSLVKKKTMLRMVCNHDGSLTF